MIINNLKGSIMKKKFILSLTIVIMLSGCVNSPNLNQKKFDNSNKKTLSDLDIVINKYKLATNYHKALAVAVDSDGGYAAGFAYDGQIQSHVNKTALQLCKKSKLQHDIKDNCEIYMMDNKIVGSLD